MRLILFCVVLFFIIIGIAGVFKNAYKEDENYVDKIQNEYNNKEE